MYSFSGLLKQNTLSLVATTNHRGCHDGTYCFTFINMHVWLGKTLISLDNILVNVLGDSMSLLTGLSKPSFGIVFLLSYVS